MKEDWYVIRGGAEPKERAAGGAVKKRRLPCASCSSAVALRSTDND